MPFSIQFLINFKVIIKTTFKLCVFLLFPIILSAESAYVEGRDPLMDRYYERNEHACIENNTKRQYACFTAGEKYIYFNKSEMQKGITYWEKSCKVREYGTACYFLGKTYLDKKSGTYYNKSKALKALTKGCELNEENSKNIGCKEGIEVCCEKLNHGSPTI